MSYLNCVSILAEQPYLENCMFLKSCELEIIVYSLLLYQYIEIENKSIQEATNIVLNKAPKKYKNKIITLYSQIEEIVKNYNFMV